MLPWFHLTYTLPLMSCDKHMTTCLHIPNTLTGDPKLCPSSCAMVMTNTDRGCSRPYFKKVTIAVFRFQSPTLSRTLSSQPPPLLPPGGCATHASPKTPLAKPRHVRSRERQNSLWFSYDHKSRKSSTAILLEANQYPGVSVVRISILAMRGVILSAEPSAKPSPVGDRDTPFLPISSFPEFP